MCFPLNSKRREKLRKNRRFYFPHPNAPPGQAIGVFALKQDNFISQEAGNAPQITLYFAQRRKAASPCHAGAVVFRRLPLANGVERANFPA
jgi:hypothetical protein